MLLGLVCQNVFDTDCCNPYGTPDFTSCGVRVTRSLILCVMFVYYRCLSFFFWPLSFLPFTDSDYPFDIFKLFLKVNKFHVSTPNAIDTI